MSTEQRIRAAVREYADAIPIPAGDPTRFAGKPAPARSTSRGWLVPLASAAAVVAVVAGLAWLPYRAPEGLARPGADQAALLPSEIPLRSWPGPLLTADVSRDPPGRAVALLRQGNGDGPPGSSQKYLVLGADGVAYRWLGAADTGDGALLSPDGTKVAYGEADAVTVVDLETGHLTSYQAEGVVDARIMAWSPDGTRIAYGERVRWTADGPGPQYRKAWGMLALPSGRSEGYEGAAGISHAAFSPDGRRVAVQDGEKLVILGPGADDRREITALDGRTLAAGGAAWSPDGARIALVASGEPEVELRMLDVARGAVTGPAYRTLRMSEHHWSGFLGWRTGDGFLVARNDREGRTMIVQVSPGRPEGTVLSRVREDPASDAAVLAGLQLASGLTPELATRNGGVDYGPWPEWLRRSIALILVAAALLVAAVLVRRHARPADTDG